MARDDSVVEGGTGNMAKTGRHYTDGKTDQELTGTIGFGGPVELDHSKSRKVLVTGAGSYIGDSFAEYAKEHYGTALRSISPIPWMVIGGIWTSLNTVSYTM